MCWQTYFVGHSQDFLLLAAYFDLAIRSRITDQRGTDPWNFSLWNWESTNRAVECSNHFVPWFPCGKKCWLPVFQIMHSSANKRVSDGWFTKPGTNKRTVQRAAPYTETAWEAWCSSGGALQRCVTVLVYALEVTMGPVCIDVWGRCWHFGNISTVEHYTYHAVFDASLRQCANNIAFLFHTTRTHATKSVSIILKQLPRPIVWFLSRGVTNAAHLPWLCTAAKQAEASTACTCCRVEAWGHTRSTISTGVCP